MAKYIDVKKAEDVLTIKAAQDRDSARRTWARAITALVDVPAADVEPVRRWIPCSERMPEYEKPVLICNDEGLFVIAFLFKGEDGWPDEWYYFYDCYDHDVYTEQEQGKIIAWMPLPEPYKGGEEE